MGDPVERHKRYLDDRLSTTSEHRMLRPQELVILLISLAFTVAVGVAVVWAGVSLATRGRHQPQAKDVSIPSGAFCHACGSQTLAGARFCSDCGAPQ